MLLLEMCELPSPHRYLCLCLGLNQFFLWVRMCMCIDACIQWRGKNNNGFIYNSRESNWSKWPRFPSRFAEKKNHTKLLKNAGAEAVRNFVTINQLFFGMFCSISHIFSSTLHMHARRPKKEESMRYWTFSSLAPIFSLIFNVHWPAPFNLLYQCQHLYFIAKRHSLAYTRTLT